MGPRTAYFRDSRAHSRDSGLVEMGGIEPPSIAVSLRLLRA